MNQKKPCICGRAYWPAQAWDHEKCVANAAIEAVANRRKPGRYRDLEKRKVYMRELMRSKRAKTKSVKSEAV